MAYNICIIDNDFPTKFDEVSRFTIDDTHMLNATDIKLMFDLVQDWRDGIRLRALIESLYQDKNEWSITAFKAPELFINYVEEETYSPDMIVFDWDYDGKRGEDEDVETLFYEIIQLKYCVINIYSGADKDMEINKMLNGGKFINFRNRVSYLSKNTDNSSSILLDQLSRRFSENFSHQYGKNLQNKIDAALNSVLSNIGELSFDEFICLFGERNNNQSHLAALDFVNIIIDKIRTDLICKGFTEPITSNYKEIKDLNHVRRVWHFRLYYKPQDDIVRKGDIIKAIDSDKWFLVISSDCHLNKFWQKNFGHLALIPIYEIGDKTIRRKIIDFTNSGTRRQFKNTSMTNPNQIENITFLPGLMLREDEYIDYLVSPKEITSYEIRKPQDVHAKSPLKYSQIDSFRGTDRYHLTEPFLTPLVNYIMKNVTDTGVPDFSDSLQGSLNDKIAGLK